MSADPTPAEIEAGAQALFAHTGTRAYPWAEFSRTDGGAYYREKVAAVLAAVLPDHDARMRADERRKVVDVPGWAHEQNVTQHGDALECCWCGGLAALITAGDSLEDVLTVARDHHRRCTHRMAAHANPPATGE